MKKQKQKQKISLLEGIRALDETDLNRVMGGSTQGNATGQPPRSEPPTIQVTNKGAAITKVQDAISAIENTIAKGGKGGKAVVEDGYTHIKFFPK